MSRVSRKVHDVCLLRLIGRFLRAGVMVDGVVQPTDEGSPQGGPLSPLLSNILLDDLDKELERRKLKFVRYADDRHRRLHTACGGSSSSAANVQLSECSRRCSDI